MEHHLLGTSSSLLLVMFLLNSILVTSHFPFGCSKQAYTHSNVSYIESERQALFQFRDGLIDESNRLSSWIGEDCCLWEGIDCHKITSHVVKLDLQNTKPLNSNNVFTYCKNCLGGQLSPFLINLTNLQDLDLSKNNFSGIQVPTFLGLLKNLRYLNLANAVFDGKIPHHLGNLSCLRHLELGGVTPSLTWNRLTKKDLRWIVGLSFLGSLVLFGVNPSAVEDGLQTINMLPSLTRLELDSCELFINPHLSQVNFTSLSSLELGENDFNDHMVPPWLHNLTSLYDLGLSSNHLSGPIHGLFEQMTSLVDLDLGENCFDVSTLKSLCNVSSLNYLDLTCKGQYRVK
ncbi:receptor-like protein EIX1 [Coffea eugenioides]|uniref:receptor-like protein EIX1 n=1 Tax=Coffea eugenioides TaxID=49369 RepID=UPI000F606CB2|nr:receptor-like protein EIX1 [Coffea eugenioides]